MTDIFPAIALAVEPPSSETMNRPPNSSKENFLSAPFFILISWQSIMLGGMTIGAYLWALQTYGEGSHARTVALLAIIGGQLGHLFNCRSKTRSAFTGFFSNRYIFAAFAIVFALQLLALYFPPLAQILDTVPPTKADFVVIVISVILPIMIVEITKIFGQRK